MPFQWELLLTLSVTGSKAQLASFAFSSRLFTSIVALWRVSIESNIDDKLCLEQYIGWDTAQVAPRSSAISIPAYLESQSRAILAAIIDAMLITVIWGLTPTAVGNTLASQTSRFLNP